MTLGDIKKKTLALIEAINPSIADLTDDEDIKAKINYVVNQIQYEVCRYKKITAYGTYEATEGEMAKLDEIAPGIYQLINMTGVEYDLVEDIVTFKETGTANVLFYKYPGAITLATADTYTMELDPDVLEIIPYGVASDLLKADSSEQYGAVYGKRYQEMLNGLDPRKGMTTITIVGGI